MISRDRVKRCISFKNPDRCPMSLPKPYPNDICVAHISDDPEWRPWRTWELEDCRQWEDEWHNVWKCFSNTTRGEVIEGVIKDWTDLETYRMPRLDMASRYEEPRRVFAENQSRYHLGMLPGFPFAIMRYMRLVENFLADILLYPDVVSALQHKIVNLLKRCMDNWATTDCDGVMFAEDWGMQDRLFVSPGVWHDMFEWGYRELVDYAHALGLDVWMHSCGYIVDIVPSLVDIGINVLQLDQPKLSGLDFLSRTCRGKTAIWSPVDVQIDLPTGEEAHIRSCARELVDKLSSREGGFICGYYAEPRSIAVEAQWQMWAVEEFAGYADQKKLIHVDRVALGR